MNTATEQFVDAHLVTLTAAEFTRKLAEARLKGRHGWWNDQLCSEQTLHDMLLEHVGKGNEDSYLDIAILAMMIHYRQYED